MRFKYSFIAAVLLLLLTAACQASDHSAEHKQAANVSSPPQQQGSHEQTEQSDGKPPNDAQHTEQQTENEPEAPLNGDDGSSQGASSSEAPPAENSSSPGTANSGPEDPSKSVSAPAQKSDRDPAPSSSDIKPPLAEAEPGTSGANSADEGSANQEKLEQVVGLDIAGLDGEQVLKADVEWEKGDTVLDILKRATRLNKIQMEYRGSGVFAYVEGIQNLYEFDYGPTSGWKYEVNGEAAGQSAGAVKVEPGDQVRWYYIQEEDSDE